MPTTLDARFVKDNLASIIANKWVTWNAARNEWLDEKKELRQYLFATDTTKTANKKLPWKNSTVLPKLTQLRDNLHANYMAALFPREQWFIWSGDDKDSVNVDKRRTIEAYMQWKLKASGFAEVVSQLVLDYIDYGNVFAAHKYVIEKHKDVKTGEEVVRYQGPKLYRISPLDIVFDVTAPSFDESPCIVRRMVSLGDIDKQVRDQPNLGYKPEVVEKLRGIRMAADQIDVLKNDGLVVDGFGSLSQYFNSGMVEILDFYGDIYDNTTAETIPNQIISIVDRRWVLRQIDNPSWTGQRPIKHVGWRLRPDNLWAQGPLDQLLGMQYRINHLENLKADVFDQIAHPIVKIKGTTVENFEFGPGIKIQCGEEGDVIFDRPDASALSANTEIDMQMAMMEELAGAPKQAMGIRTPGEKTKYEVQVLENGAGRIFQSKVNWFEKNLIEPILNSMLEESVKNMNGTEKVKQVNPDLGTQTFAEITKEDLTAMGKFYAIGARHFAEKAMFTQELVQTLQVAQTLPQVAVHISGKKVAKALSNAMGWDSFDIVRDNVSVFEQAETQKLAQAAQEQATTAGGMPSELQPGDTDGSMEGQEMEGPEMEGEDELPAQ